MKVYLLINEDYCDEFRDHILGAYSTREAAEARLAEIHFVFQAYDEAWEVHRREVFRLCRRWIAERGLEDRTFNLFESYKYGGVIRTLQWFLSLDLDDEDKDVNASLMKSNIEAIRDQLAEGDGLPQFPCKPSVDHLPDGDADDYSIIELEVDVP